MKWPEFQSYKLIAILQVWSFKMCYKVDLMTEEKCLLIPEHTKGKTKLKI